MLCIASVDVVGKYCYKVRDPQGESSMPIIVDVMLVGRTKILKLHSPLWLENNTQMKLRMTLHLSSLANGRHLLTVDSWLGLLTAAACCCLHCMQQVTAAYAILTATSAV